MTLNFGTFTTDKRDDMLEKNTHNPKRLRRYHVKVLGNAVLEKNGVEESFLSNTVNISLSGALIETGHEMPLGSLLRYCFKIPGVSRTFNILAEVVRCEEQGLGALQGQDMAQQQSSREKHHLQLYGIRFLDLSEQDRADIACYLFQ